jgi:hypothetical protein
MLSLRFQLVSIEENEYHTPFEKPVSKLKKWVTQPSSSKGEAANNSKDLTPLWVELWMEKLAISPSVGKLEIM